MERPEAFDLVGTKTTLIGPELKPGDAAPDFQLLNNKLATVTLSDLADRPMLISVVPSLDTPVCSIQTNRFNEEVAAFADKVHFITVSADLPFAQARWCKSNEASNVKVLSDHRDMSFGDAYGTHVKEARIESRAVFVVDKDGVMRHVEYVGKAADQPDYDAVLKTLHEVAG
ncbi:MAG: thiol peroxidase [Chloroflexaceae bacterium]|nr:thiol peroxidase [Chloroflexaceae bacterium]